MKNVLADSEKDVVINELYCNGSDDWIELYNQTAESINLSSEKYRIHKVKGSFSGTIAIRFEEDGDGIFQGGKIIPAKGHYLLVRDDANEELKSLADVIVTRDEFTLSCSGYALYLGTGSISSDSDGDIVDKIGYGNSAYCEENQSPEIEEKKSIKRNSASDNSENKCSKLIPENNPTPTNSRNETLKKPEPKEYPAGIYINEFLPNPKEDEDKNEYIELYNSSAKDIDLVGWILKDKTAAGKYAFPKGSDIKAGDFLIVYRKDFDFAINNSDESLFLLDPNEKNVFEVSFADSAREDFSYSFDSQGSSWRWTSKKTPGAKNDFDKVLSGKIKKDDPVYVGIYANFEVNADSDAGKFTWNFGDGHKSYLKKTRHKYEKAGKYAGSLKISGNGEGSEYFFTVDVEKYKAPKIRIKSISPNPKGKDSENEYIVLENKSKKKINLNGWSIATGWDNLYNHPIKKDFNIKSGKTKKLTRDICAFTLNNTKTKIELRDPSGKVVQKIKYDRTKNKIEEDEIYQEGNWLKPDIITENAGHPLPLGGNAPTETREGRSEEISPLSLEINISPEEIQANLGKFSEDPAWNSKKENKIILLSYNTNIKTPASLVGSFSRVAGASTEKNIPPSQKHWLMEIANVFWTMINSTANNILNKFI